MAGKGLRKKLIGDRAFYSMVLSVVLPMILQNGITNFVSLLDNIMVGRVGTEQMSGVAIVNQIVFVYNLCIFGGLAGAGIFTAQFFGRRDERGIRYTFRFKVMLGVILTILGLLIYGFLGETLISQYLSESAEGGDLQVTLQSGLDYLHVMMLGLPAFMLVQVYTSTLRECSETVLPMKAGIAAVLVNLVFNFLLIYGHLGFPKMGVVGAAAATVLSRYVELAIVLVWTHRHVEMNRWIQGAWQSMHVPSELTMRIIRKGMPLLVNEALWSSAMAFLNQCYSVRGLSVVAAMNICSTITNLFNTIFLSMGSAVSILVGQRLGAGDMEGARDTDNKMIAFSMFLATCSGLVMILTAPLFPSLYNTTDQVRHLATTLMRIYAFFWPQVAFMNATYFTLRSGGKTIITFVFDSVFVWLVSIPIAYCLSHFTGLPVEWIVVFVQMGDWLKCILGFYLVRKGVWLQNMVSDAHT